jgi:pilus assembly protein CpaC
MQRKALVEILAEPNVLAINGKQASFLAGGEYPYPILQGGGGGLGTVTIQFREFGVRINFLPVITPRGTIRLEVAPEVSALDFASGLVFQGFSIPALTVRRVHTEIELIDGQSFAIGGLLDRRLTETLSKIPVLADIPVLGKIFQSRSLNKQNSELLVIVTPELVRPIPAGQTLPQLDYPKELMGSNAQPRTPGIAATGGAGQEKPPGISIPIEQLIQSMKQTEAGGLSGGSSASGLADSSWRPQTQMPPLAQPVAAPARAPDAPAAQPAK